MWKEGGEGEAKNQTHLQAAWRRTGRGVRVNISLSCSRGNKLSRLSLKLAYIDIYKVTGLWLSLYSCLTLNSYIEYLDKNILQVGSEQVMYLTVLHCCIQINNRKRTEQVSVEQFILKWINMCSKWNVFHVFQMILDQGFTSLSLYQMLMIRYDMTG